MRVLAKTFSKRLVGFSFYLAWNFATLYCCSLTTYYLFHASLEMVWLMAGLFELLAATAVVLGARRGWRIDSRQMGLIAAACGAVGSFFVWLCHFAADLFFMLFPVAGFFVGAGLALMGAIWGIRLEEHDETMIEFSVPFAFALSFIVYFIVLFLKISSVFDLVLVAAFPFASMWLAFRRRGADGEKTAPVAGQAAGAFAGKRTVPGSIDRATSNGTENRMGIGWMLPVGALFAALWFQTAFLRILTMPLVVGDRLTYFLYPFSVAFLLSVVGFLFCLNIVRRLDFTLMFRWGLPLLVLSYAALFVDMHSEVQRTLAFTLNFMGMFGILLSAWVSAAKQARRAGGGAATLFSILLGAEGAGIFLGCAAGLALTATMNDAFVQAGSLAALALTVLVVMVTGFSPHLKLERGSALLHVPAGALEEGADAEGVAEDAAHGNEQLDKLFMQKAQRLKKDYLLTDRETEVAALLIAGRSRPYIRDELVISLNTVHVHVRNIFSKCGIHSQQDLIELARKSDPEAPRASGS